MSEKKKRVPGKRCVVMFCNKTNADGVSLHQFPKDSNLSRKWTTFVRHKRDPKTWTPGSGYVCSAHFLSQDYEGYGAKIAGFSSKPVLKKGAVPSIQPVPTPDQVAAARSANRKRSASTDTQEASTGITGDSQSKDCIPKRRSRAVSKLTAHRVCTLLTTFSRLILPVQNAKAVFLGKPPPDLAVHYQKNPRMTKREMKLNCPTRCRCCLPYCSVGGLHTCDVYFIT